MVIVIATVALVIELGKDSFLGHLCGGPNRNSRGSIRAIMCAAMNSLCP